MKNKSTKQTSNQRTLDSLWPNSPDFPSDEALLKGIENANKPIKSNADFVDEFMQERAQQGDPEAESLLMLRRAAVTAAGELAIHSIPVDYIAHTERWSVPSGSAQV